VVVLPHDGPLVGELSATGAEVHVRPTLAVLRRGLFTPSGLARVLARAAADARALAGLARRRGARLVHTNTSVTLGGPAAARSALDLPEDAFTCLVLGRLNSWKGQEVLARALSEPSLRERGAIGLVAGDAWPGEERHERALRALRTDLGLGDRLRLLGFRDDLEALFGAADVVCVPSTRPEPLGLAALEAAAAAKCVVASNAGGLREIVRDGETGRLVSPGSPPALANTLAELADEPDL